MPREGLPPGQAAAAERAARRSEVGGGFVVLSRGRRHGRLRAHPFPTEHGSEAAASAEAAQLAARHGQEFVVFQAVGSAQPPSPEAPEEKPRER